jgi:DNA polymerase-3 subunit gamma/tau
MLLKGLAEVEQAPDRKSAAEMVLIRLCHVADLPPPGDLVRRLMEQPAAHSGPAPTVSGHPGGGTRAVSNGAPRLQTEPAPQGQVLATFRDVAQLVADRREATLHAHLVHSVHIVRFAPPVIELRQAPDAPRDLAARLGAVLTDATGVRWTIALSSQPGEPTLADQGDAADGARRAEAQAHPLVRAILDAFPGARIEAVNDSTTDSYGLPATPQLGGGDEPDGFDLPPPDEPIDEPADFWETAP